MKTLLGIGFAAVVAAAVTSVANAAEPGAPRPAARYYPLVGHWKGSAQLSEPGQKPLTLTLALDCRKAAAGSAVRCDLIAKNAKMTMRESDLFGVDAATGQGHWYAISDQGDAHDHLTQWSDAKTMTASHAWTQEGKHMEERVTFSLPTRKALEFHSVVTADGEEVNTFSGKMSR